MKAICVWAMLLTITFVGSSQAAWRGLFQPALESAPVIDNSYVDNGHEAHAEPANYGGCATCGQSAGYSAGCGASAGCYSCNRPGYAGCKTGCCQGLWDNYCAERRHFCPTKMPAPSWPRFGCGMHRVLHCLPSCQPMGCATSVPAGCTSCDTNYEMSQPTYGEYEQPAESYPALETESAPIESPESITPADSSIDQEKLEKSARRRFMSIFGI
ncbi:MAG: hypothetical protein R3C99_07775 [Pirellulaceae bacterium]